MSSNGDPATGSAAAPLCSVHSTRRRYAPAPAAWSGLVYLPSGLCGWRLIWCLVSERPAPSIRTRACGREFWSTCGFCGRRLLLLLDGYLVLGRLGRPALSEEQHAPRHERHAARVLLMVWCIALSRGYRWVSRPDSARHSVPFLNLRKLAFMCDVVRRLRPLGMVRSSPPQRSVTCWRAGVPGRTRA